MGSSRSGRRNCSNCSANGYGLFSGGNLPYQVPKTICQQLAPVAESIKKEYQEQMLQQFGSIEENAFPPCMHALITALTAGTTSPMPGGFALTTFVHTVGMDVPAIARLYARSPDFDAEKTMYQVEHITGRGGSGTEYTAPACAAMRTTGLCVNRDPLCERVKPPAQLLQGQKKGPGTKRDKKKRFQKTPSA